MPDWSYRTVFQPILFQLPFETARSIALGSLGRLAKLPGGHVVIDLMGHMAPDERLQTNLADHTLASPLMLGCRVDPELTATPALARFGFGLIEVGPVAVDTRYDGIESQIEIAKESLIVSGDGTGVSSNQAASALKHSRLGREAVMVRMAIPQMDTADNAIEACQSIISNLSDVAANFAIPLSLCGNRESISKIVAELVNRLSSHSARLLIVANTDDSDVSLSQSVEMAIKAGAAGIVIDGQAQRVDGRFVVGAASRCRVCELTRDMRAHLGPEVPIIAGGGVHEPINAVRLIEAGATMVQIDSGLIFSGPGLPKRCNDALLCHRVQTSTVAPSQAAAKTGRQAWLWTLLLGLSMLIGGAMAMTIAVTRVVMPYDEQFVGMTRTELIAVNDRLLLFMTHDRVTLAGTMLALGTLYSILSWHGVRRGLHWAYIAVIASSFVGFFTFFAFLGFGYFDPLHAFVTAILFQFLLLGIHSEIPQPAFNDVPNLTNHSSWQLSQWGQMLWIVHGAILIVAGGVICTYGMTSVFVPEDLDFMQTTAEELCIANPQLVPLVAHDRATFGGMLIAIGFTVLLVSLWGFRQGNAWLWWALLIAGNIAYIATILVHWVVGYTSLWHLLPAYGGFTLLWIAAGLSRRWLCSIDRTDQELWETLTHS